MRLQLRPNAPVLASLVLGSLLAACGSVHHGHGGHHAGSTASAKIEAKSGSGVSGTARFAAKQGGVLVTLEIHGASPGWHAAHLHEKGDCSAPDGTSAGGHFNPGSHAHGSPHAPEHHAGDLGNMWIEADGTGFHAIFMPELTLDDGDWGVVGRAVIVHAGADDLVSQPTGAAGGRIGCGVIRLDS